MEERRINPADVVTRTDFDAFKARVEPTLSRIESALFAQDSNNEFQSRGVMTVMRKLDTHIDFVCAIWRCIWTSITALVTVGVPVVGVIGQLRGWW